MSTNSSNLNLENRAICLPITREIRDIAGQFATNQPTQEKAEQVRLNTIAVSVVNNYLSMLSVATDLTGSDSWNPVMQLCENVADLNLIEVGKLECRPIKSSDSSCHVPLEVWDLRIGYIVVQIDDDYRKATILGFTPKVASEELAIAELDVPEALLDCIHTSPVTIGSSSQSLTNLGQWLNEVFETGWQTVENLLNPEQLTPAYGFRNSGSQDDSEENSTDSSVTRAKLVDLNVQLSDHSVVLLVKLTPEDSTSEENKTIGVTLQVLPQNDQAYLPAGLELKVLEASSQAVFMETQARSRDNFVQLQFSGQPEEQFQVQISLDGIDFSEQFQL